MQTIDICQKILNTMLKAVYNRKKDLRNTLKNNS